MCIVIIKNELRINSIRLIACTDFKTRMDLLQQRSNLKDMLINILEQRTLNAA